MVLSITITAKADIFEQPYRVFPKEYKEAFDKVFYPYVLDLDPNDTTRSSLAFLESKGAYFIISTYRNFSWEEIQKLFALNREQIGKSLSYQWNPVPLNQSGEWLKEDKSE